MSELSREPGKEEEAQPRLFLAFLNQSSLPFHKPSLAAGFFFLWVFALCGEQVFLCGSHFLYRGKLGFFREPYLVPPSLYFLNLCKQLWLPSSLGIPPRMGVKPLRRRGCTSSLAWSEVGGMHGRGQGKMKGRLRGLFCPLELGELRAWQMSFLAGLEISK